VNRCLLLGLSLLDRVLLLDEQCWTVKPHPMISHLLVGDGLGVFIQRNVTDVIFNGAFFDLGSMRFLSGTHSSHAIVEVLNDLDLGALGTFLDRHKLSLMIVL